MKDQYLTLLTSLPALSCPVASKEDSNDTQITLSETQLMLRLTMLDESTHRELQQLLKLCPLVRYELKPFDTDHWKQQFEVLIKPEARSLARWFVELASVLAAIRIRVASPDHSEPLPLYPGRFGWVIKTHWQDKHFDLDNRFPAIIRWNAWAKEHQWKLIERDAVRLAWDYLDRLVLEKPFSFTALAVYWLKWHWVQQWTARQAEPLNFEKCLERTLNQVLERDCKEVFQ